MVPTPEQTLGDRKLFLAHLMTYGTLDDVRTVKKHWGDGCFKEVLDSPPPGIFDPRSWAYWNLIYDRNPVPPLPTRQIPGL